MIIGAQNDRILPSPLAIFLFDGVSCPKPVFPGSLQRTSHQSILRLDSVILATSAFGVIPGAFSTQRPLLLKLARFIRRSICRGNRDLDLIRRERLQQGTRDEVIDSQGSDLLA